MNKKVSITGANLVFLIFVALFMLFQIIIGILSSFLGEEYLNNNIYKILFVNEYLLILIPVLVYAFIKKLNFKEVFKLNRLGIFPALIIILAAFPATFVASMLNELVVYLIQFIGKIPAQPIPVPHNLKELGVGMLMIAVTPAICEEMLHRGLLLKAYENRGTIKAVVIVAILFGIFHFDITNLLGPILLGILIGYYVIRTNSIFAGMLAHFVNNGIALLMLYQFRNSGPLPKFTTISSLEMLQAIIIGLIGLGILVLLVWLFKFVTRKTTIIKPSISSIREDAVSVITNWPIAIIVSLYVVLITIGLGSYMLLKYSGIM